MKRSFVFVPSVMCLSLLGAAENEVVWRDSFDDAAAKTRWNCDRG